MQVNLPITFIKYGKPSLSSIGTLVFLHDIWTFPFALFGCEKHFKEKEHSATAIVKSTEGMEREV